MPRTAAVEEANDPQTHAVLDPRVAFLVTSLMEDVINHGTGVDGAQWASRLRRRGRPGSSRDGWFAGFTSNLLCVVWIGFDDNRDLDLTGGLTAAPIWGEFMKRAVLLPAYRNTQEFEPPAGVVQEVNRSRIRASWRPPRAPRPPRSTSFPGREPTPVLSAARRQRRQRNRRRIMAVAPFRQEARPRRLRRPALMGSRRRPTSRTAPARSRAPERRRERPPAGAEPEKKKGLLDKIFGIFGGSKKPPDNPPDKPQDQP